MPVKTFHNFERKISNTRKKIQRADICNVNKKILFDFERFCVAEGLSLARRWKLLEYLHVFATKYFHHSFRRATSKQIWDAVFKIESSDLAIWTKHDFKVAIRKLFKFVEWGNDALMRKGYPSSVEGISTRVKKKDQVKIQAGDILTEEEIKKMLSATDNTMQKALVSIMYELGARVGEVGTMCIGDISKDNHSFICDVNGKTGPRSVRIIMSAGVLTAWLNLHPDRNNASSPLWGHLRKGLWKPHNYTQIAKKVKKLAHDAGISKRVHPHLLRHSRITHVLANGQLNEAQAKVYFGLVADSSMLSTYSHLVFKDANDAVLKMYGISPTKAPSTAMPQNCGMCGELNEDDGKFCIHCGYTLNHNVAMDESARFKTANDRILRFLKEPGIKDAFREMVRKEIEGALSKDDK